MNDLIFLILSIMYYLMIGLVIDMAFVAPMISEHNKHNKYNKIKNEKIPSYLIITILIITPFTYPILYILFYGAMFCWEFKEQYFNYNIKKRFHDYFNLD